MRQIIFIITIILLTSSCKNTTVSPSLPQQVLKDSIPPLIDSNYLEKVERIKEDPYSDNYDTLLKRGYNIEFRHDSTDQYLIYKKGQKTIDTIGETSLGILYKNLGYVGVDFDKHFVFVQSFGSGNPHTIRLYEKETAKNLIEEGSAWIDVDTTNEILLYSANDVPSSSDSMTIYDLKHNTRKNYPFPKEVFGEAEICNRIRLKTITDKFFVIEYDTDDYNKTGTKKYNR